MRIYGIVSRVKNRRDAGRKVTMPNPHKNKFMPASLQELIELERQVRTMQFDFEQRIGGFSHKSARILCALAQEDGLTYWELSDKTGLDRKDLLYYCKILAEDSPGNGAHIRKEKSATRKGRVKFFVTDIGRRKHAEIVQKG